MAAVLLRAPADVPDEVPAVVSIDENGLRYEFRVLSGSEYVWDLNVPEHERTNRLRDLPDEAARMRRALERRLRIDDLESLHEPHRATAERLRELGYL